MVAYNYGIWYPSWNFISINLSDQKLYKIDVNISPFDVGSIVISSGITHIFVRQNVNRTLGFTWDPKCQKLEKMANQGIEYNPTYQLEKRPRYKRITAVEYLM